MESTEKKPEKDLEHAHVTQNEVMELVAGWGSPLEKIEDSPLYKIRNCRECWEKWHHIL